MKEETPMTNSRKPFPVPPRSSAERLSSATRLGRNASTGGLDADQPVLEAGHLRVVAHHAQQPFLLHALEIHPPASSVPEELVPALLEGQQQAPLAGGPPPARNCVTVSVLPVPVAPETRITESRKNPPPHMRSSSGLPDEIRTSDDFWRKLDGGERDHHEPPVRTMVKGNSPF
jgi:hypothetical protein